MCYNNHTLKGGISMSNHKLTTKKIVMVALLAALTTAGSALRIKIPVSFFGTSAFHLGNILCALSGILLGPWLGGLAAGLGSAIYDMFDPFYISECWITFLTKGAYGLAAGLVAWSGKKVWSADSAHSCGKAYLATITGALVYAGIYLSKSFFYNGMLLAGLAPAAAGIMLLDKLPATVFNAAIAIICAPPLAIAISKALVKNHLSTR